MIVEQQRLRRHLQQVDQIIVTADVRQFMQQNGFHLSRAQARDQTHRHQNHGAKIPDDKGYVGQAGFQQSDRPGQPHASAEAVQAALPSIRRTTNSGVAETPGGHPTQQAAQMEEEHSGESHVEYPHKTFSAAMWQIIVADVSMSLDNILAVVGIARTNLTMLVVGLVMSIVLMAVASSLIAALLARYRWISYIGLALIVFVAVKMMWDGGLDVAHHFGWVAAA